MKTERVDFPDGSWWEFQPYLSHGVAKRVREVMQRYLKAVKDTVEIDWGALNLHELNETMILAGTTAWSYGPLDKATLEGQVPEEHFQAVLAKMNRLYGGAGAVPLAVNGNKNSRRGFSPLSFVTSLFHRK